MLTGEIRSQIDAIWDAFWSGGISNPLEVIEQITYLLFLRRLSSVHALRPRMVRLSDGQGHNLGALAATRFGGRIRIIEKDDYRAELQDSDMIEASPRDSVGTPVSPFVAYGPLSAISPIRVSVSSLGRVSNGPKGT